MSIFQSTRELKRVTYCHRQSSLPVGLEDLGEVGRSKCAKLIVIMVKVRHNGLNEVVTEVKVTMLDE